MATRKQNIRGISGIYIRTGGATPVDTLFARTSPEGVQIQMQLKELMVEVGDSQFAEDIIITSAGTTATGQCVAGDLSVLSEILGVDLTGDLTGATPSDEVLELYNAGIGNSTQAKCWVIKSPGAGAGSREYVFTRAKMSLNGDMTIGRDQLFRPGFKLTVLAAADDTTPVFTITDKAS